MKKPQVLVITGYGINCEEETAFAFQKAGAQVRVVHVNDLIEAPKKLKDFQIMVFPGGFSFGDDTGSGYALANRIKNYMWEIVREFIEKDKLLLGICNGFQVMVNLGILPAVDNKYGEVQAALLHNKTMCYECRWVDLRVESDKCIMLKDIKYLHIPVAHGEGNFFAQNKIIQSLKQNDQIALTYRKKDNEPANGEFPYNPNGSIMDIAAVCDKSGRVLGMMPHPERYITFTQRDDWTFLKDKYLRKNKSFPKYGDGFKIFKNSVDYFL